MEKYRNTIEFEVYGAYALFSDPVMRVGELRKVFTGNHRSFGLLMR